jgi:hypothetical protein
MIVPISVAGARGVSEVLPNRQERAGMLALPES